MTITCADCGSMQQVPVIPGRGTVECGRCDRILARRTGAGLDVSLACSVATFVLLPPAVFMPLMHSTIRNLVFQESRLVSSVPVIYSEVWFPLAFGFFFFAFIFPALRAILMVVVLGSLRSGWKIPQRGRIFRWCEELKSWCMTEVVVVAGLVAYARAQIPADVDVLAGAWCYLAVATLAFAAEHWLDRRAVWNAILPDCTIYPRGHAVSCDMCEFTDSTRQPGDRCPRCGAKLDRNITRSFIIACAAIAAAIPLFIPAYSAAVMVNDQLTGVLEHTVIGTVQLLADRGYWAGGVVVLLAGIAVPFVELLGLSWLLLRVRFPERDGLVLRTRFYRLLHRIVRWPMILPFITAIAAPIVDFRGIDDIVAGYGATPLFMLIVLLMVAMRFFEPRLMWKTAGATS